MPAKSWSGRVALITGASSGIGLAAARAFVARGARVALVTRSKGPLEEAAAALGADRARAFPLDVTDREALQALPLEVVRAFGHLDIVVNNAGVNHRGALRDLDPAQVASIFETNLVAPALLTHAALPHLAEGGVVVNVASLAGKVPVPHEASYSGSKAGLRAFSRALDAELAEHAKSPHGRIRVVTVCPGPVDTGFIGSPEAIAQVPNLVFSQPMSTAEEVADAIVRAVETDAREIDVPALSGKLATLGYLSPAIFAKLRPALEARGAANKRKYVASLAKRGPR